MLNHKPKEAVAGAFVRRLPTDVNDSTAKSGLGHEHNAHSVGAAYCILANRSANMPVPCRKSVRCGGSSSQQHTRRMTAASRAIAPVAFSFGGVRKGRIAPAVYPVCGLTPCGEPQGSPCPSVRSANPHGVALPLSLIHI